MAVELKIALHWLWRVSVLLECVLLARLILWRVWRTLPAFVLFVGYESLRAVALLVADTWFPGHWNAVQLPTEPLSIALLLAMGLESATGRRKASVLGLMAFGMGAVLFGFLWLSNQPPVTYLWVRATVGLAVAAYLIPMLATGKWSAHQAIMTAFVLVDVLCNLSKAIGVADLRPDQCMVVGQTICLASWLWKVPELGKADEQQA